MFNRAIQVKVVKTKKEEPQKVQPTDKQLEDTMTVISYHTDRVIEKIGSMVVAYVVVDTLRKILIARASRS